MKIGVLALQGAVAEHVTTLSELNVKAVPIYLPSELNSLDGLIIPGGESTTISKLMLDYNLAEPIQKLASQGLPIFGTCAGMILLASKLTGPNSVKPLGLMDIEVKRNAFGRQVDSFEVDLPIPALGDKAFRGIFIRAPVIEKTGPEVGILCQLGDGSAVAVRQGKSLACAFHPELTGDLRFHKYFLALAAGDVLAKSNNR